MNNPDTSTTPTWKVCKCFNSALLQDEKEGEILNEIQCCDRDEAQCLVDLLNGKERELAEKTAEVSAFKEALIQMTTDARNWHEHYRDERDKAQKCKQAFFEQEKEVERLRELLERALKISPLTYPDSCEQKVIREDYNQLTK